MGFTLRMQFRGLCAFVPYRDEVPTRMQVLLQDLSDPGESFLHREQLLPHTACVDFDPADRLSAEIDYEIFFRRGPAGGEAERRGLWILRREEIEAWPGGEAPQNDELEIIQGNPGAFNAYPEFDQLDAFAWLPSAKETFAHASEIDSQYLGQSVPPANLAARVLARQGSLRTARLALAGGGAYRVSRFKVPGAVNSTNDAVQATATVVELTIPIAAEFVDIVSRPFGEDWDRRRTLRLRPQEPEGDVVLTIQNMDLTEVIHGNCDTLQELMGGRAENLGIHDALLYDLTSTRVPRNQRPVPHLEFPLPPNQPGGARALLDAEVAPQLDSIRRGLMNLQAFAWDGIACLAPPCIGKTFAASEAVDWKPFRPDEKTQVQSREAARESKNLPQEKRVYLLGHPVARLLSPDARVLSNGDHSEWSVVSLDSAELIELGGRIHGELNLCGGFLDIDEPFRRGLIERENPLAFIPRLSVPLPAIPAAPQFPDQVAAVLARATQQRLQSFWDEVTRFPDRFAESDAGRESAAWLLERTRSLASGRRDVSVTPVRVHPTRDIQHSVIVRIKGAQENRGVLLGAHFDTINTAKGGDDDASGTATVLAVYEAILNSNLKFTNDIYFAFYAAEEIGLLGSQRIADQFVRRNEPLRGVMQLDMTGFRSSADAARIFFVTNDADAGLTSFCAQLAQRYVGLNPADLGRTAFPNGFQSDHAAWNLRGYRTVFPFEASAGNKNPHIHTPQDDSVDLNHAMLFLKLATAYAVEMAEPMPADGGRT